MSIRCDGGSRASWYNAAHFKGAKLNARAWIKEATVIQRAVQRDSAACSRKNTGSWTVRRCLEGKPGEHVVNTPVIRGKDFRGYSGSVFGVTGRLMTVCRTRN
jgi:hypothetical protein